MSKYIWTRSSVRVKSLEALTGYPYPGPWYDPRTSGHVQIKLLRKFPRPEQIQTSDFGASFLTLTSHAVFVHLQSSCSATYDDIRYIYPLNTYNMAEINLPLDTIGPFFIWQFLIPIVCAALPLEYLDSGWHSELPGFRMASNDFVRHIHSCWWPKTAARLA